MATASQVASVIRENFFVPSRGELEGMNNNGVPIRMILISIFEPGGSLNEDAGLIGSAFAVDNPYEFVGADRDPDDPFSGNRHAYNYFRLGDFENSEFPSANVQRRIVLVDGSTSELLFSLTPEGTSGIVIPQIDAEAANMFAAINSVTFAPTTPEVESISLTEFEVDDSEVSILFESTPEVTGFEIVASETLEGEFNIDLTEMAAIEEIEPGEYQATIDRAEAGLTERVFLRVEFGESE